MSVKVFSSALIGLEARDIEVEVDFTPGLHSFSIVGLPDKAVEESKERVSSAVKNSGARPPQHHNRRLTVNLAPADLKKQGPGFDLAIAVGFLLASEQMKKIDTRDKIFIGELSLDGSLRRVNGVLPAAILAKKENKILVLPKANQKEAELVEDLKILPVENLKELLEKLEKGGESIIGKGANEIFKNDEVPEVDFAFIQGVEGPKRALQIAAAGGHNIFLMGSPGGGKTLLSRSLPTILPRMTKEEILEVTRIYSVAGLLPKEKPIMSERPFRSPHHSSSSVALIGGGTRVRPGEITLAHRGVLFLDEFPEFHRDVIEALRQPMEDGMVQVSRAEETIVFPARFTLVAAANPCPCGYLNDPQKACTCTSGQITRYRRKLSGPILDRIDIKIDVPRIGFEKLTAEERGEDSETIRERIEKAREVQEERGVVNSEMKIPQIKEYCKIDIISQDLLRNAMQRLNLSPRSYHKVLKVARTIADLEGKEQISRDHLAEAIKYQEMQE
ncbi:MAG TPA: YifB family Mg chelatase-like AAA ATPase [Candidatus Pacearchaeota archaeon]|nr:YifB family Mg chelatase-like AAA ATPase [Candidatus Pacearchaeota archaeon]HQD89140.1 YifB family Mg chelatase-like AAA ATPase [Candidatus Pacearchaeota archaeon]